MSVRVVTALGHAEPQWETARGEKKTAAVADGVRLVACNVSRCRRLATAGGPHSIVLAHVGEVTAGATDTLVDAEGMPVELRRFASEEEMLRAFEALVTTEADPDVIRLTTRGASACWPSDAPSWRARA